ncbi:MAG: LysM peptidoglycan-binding domain-containing protein, partial [Ardenticatenales bacterium]
IAGSYGMRAADLAALNGVRPTAVLLPGRTVRVPVVRAANARAGAPAGAASDGGAHTLQADVGGSGGADAGGAADGAATPYEVVSGDTLYGLAERFDVDIETIKRRNGLPADGSIFAGQTLQIPTRAAGTAIARAGSEAADGADDDGTLSPTAPDHDALDTTDTITVALGETLSAIAAREGTTAAALIRLNGLDGDAIYEGQTLQVPHAGSGVIGGGGAKRIEVDISEQRMYVFEGGNLAFNWTASTGVASHPTRTGSFAVQSKVPNAWSSAWQLWMPDWLGIYWAGGSENGIHALPIINGTTLWGGLLGSPVSYGCVVLETADAETLYNWADIGTPVEIHD